MSLDVPALVQAATDDKALPWRARKEHAIETVKTTADMDLLLLLCADKLDNIRAMRRDYEKVGEALWTRFNAGADDLEWYYAALAEAFESRLKVTPGVQLARELRTEVNRMLYRPGRRPPRYPVPDRSDRIPNFVKGPENDKLDIGWNEGTLSDGRPCRAESWCQDQVTVLTIFFSTRGLETATNRDLAQLLVDEGLVTFAGEKRYVAGACFRDPRGTRCGPPTWWSVTRRTSSPRMPSESSLTGAGQSQATLAEEARLSHSEPATVSREAQRVLAL